jgi:hypothetical protein
MCKIWSLYYCAAGIYKVMQLSCHRVTPKISPQTNAPFMQPRTAQIVPFSVTFTNEGQLISETILMKRSLDAAPPFPRTWQHGLSKDWEEMCQQNKEMLQNFEKFGTLMMIDDDFTSNSSTDYRS